jgi:2-iminobutanoate/2-iminopropanoate deaminase
VEIKKEVITGPLLPRVIGHYSPAVRFGDLIFLSAQAGIDQTTGSLVEGDFRAECEQALANVALALDGCGASLEDILKTTVFCTGAEHIAVINEVYRAAFPVDPPARAIALVQLAGGLRVSIDVVASIPAR